MKDDCIFCKIAAGTAPATILHADDDVVAFRDVNPQAPTHVLLIPRRHVARLSELAPGESSVIAKIVDVANAVAREQGLADGFRIVVNNGRRAGETVPHLHAHLLGGRALRWPPG
jgi:histidine triad (HIT) family protein